MYFKPCKYQKKPHPKNGRPLGEKVKFGKLAAVFLILAGVFTLSIKVAIPYIKASLNTFDQRPLFSPVLGYKTGVDTKFTFEELDKYNKAPKSILPLAEKDIPDKFYLTIPKLEIYDAPVKVNDMSLNPDKMLGHYFGTALPGESQNAFIYGHSSLEEYFDPKNFKTIFSTLPKLTVGETFDIKYKDRQYKYIITMKKILEPEDVNPYQNYYPETPNASTVTLMTCVPPGRKDFRLIVVGSLVN